VLPPQQMAGKLEDFFEYVALSEKYGCLTYPDLKMHAQWFTKGMRGGIELRRKISLAKRADAIKEIMAGAMR
jgi:tRNA-dihydrouridine synthase B